MGHGDGIISLQPVILTNTEMLRRANKDVADEWDAPPTKDDEWKAPKTQNYDFLDDYESERKVSYSYTFLLLSWFST